MAKLADIGAIGIDLGTTKMSIALLKEDDTNTVEVTLPTTLKIDNPEASHEAPIQASKVGGEGIDVWRHFKLDMGLPAVSPERCGASYLFSEYRAPHHLAAICLRQGIKNLLRKFISGWSELAGEHSYVIESATVSVPAMWNLSQRRATVFAARVAGIRKVHLIEEPVAAYLYLEKHYPQLRKHSVTTYTLVFDFGGGTCDMVIIKSDPGQLPTVVNREMVKIGGRNIDEGIDKYWERYLTEHDPNFNFEGEDPPPDLVHKLLSKAKEIKHSLNPPDRENILQDPLNSRSPASPPPDSITYRASPESEQIKFELPALKAEDFDEIANRLWDRPDGIKAKLDRLLEHPEIEGDPQNVNQVIMVGGSSYVRPIIAKLRDVFYHLEVGENDYDDNKNFFLHEPEEAIALGASYFQFQLKRRSKVIQPTSAFNTLLEIDYDLRRSNLLNRIPASLSLWLERVESFRPNQEKVYYILGRRNQVLSRLNLHRLVMPMPSGRRLVSFKIYQTVLNEEDFRNGCFVSRDDLVDEVQIPIRTGVAGAIYYYRFDRFGGFRRTVITYPLPVKKRFRAKMPWDPEDSNAISRSWHICFGKEK